MGMTIPTGRAIPVVARLAKAVDAIHERERAEVGDEDARLLQGLLRLSRVCALKGRRAIRDGRGFRAWADGVGQLASHYILEMSNGHAVMHGALDGLRDIDSTRYRWNNTVTAEDWRVDHNEVHHPHTNLWDRDPDFALLYFRFTERQPWRPRHLVQVPILCALPLTVTWFIPLVAALGRARHEGRAAWSWRSLKPLAGKVLAEWRDNYVRPWRGPRALRSVLGHAAAKTASNVIVGAALFASHHGESALDLEAEDSESRGESYLRQILCTLNIRMRDPKWEDTHLRGVNFHIEHHLFPDLPVERLRRVGSDLRAVCEELELPHETTSVPGAMLGILQLAARYSLPITTPSLRQQQRRDLYRRLCEEHRRWKALQPLEEVGVDVFALRLQRSEKQVPVRSDEPLLAALERAGVTVATGCRKGSCQTCRTKKISGVTSQERHRGRTHVNVCIAQPRSDVVLDC